jgi:hypothetical protein
LIFLCLADPPGERLAQVLRGYRNKDDLKAGSAMTIAFHLIVVAMISLFYLK